MPVKNISELSTNTYRRRALDTLNNALISLNPKNAVRDRANAVIRDIPDDAVIKVFGFGKAGETMYSGLKEVLAERIRSAFLIIPEDEEFRSQYPELTVLRGTHPLPSALSLVSSVRLVQEIEKCTETDYLIFLVSGGGSALFEIPEKGLSIDDISSITKCVMDGGAEIGELNTIRISLSAVKGGKLLERIKGSRVHALYISDVVSNDLHFIASGPLVPYVSYDTADQVFSKFPQCFNPERTLEIKRAWKQHSAVQRENVVNDIVLSNEDFVRYLQLKLETEKKVLNLGHTLKGDVEQLARNILSRLRAEAQKRKTDFWFVGAGESTVTVRGNGSGGRNQELCLHILRNLKSEEKVLFISAGTDGIDGNSPAMGGIVDHETLEDTNVDEMTEYIDRNDSYTFLSEHNGAIMSGRTGNNVSDVILGHYDTWGTGHRS